MEFLAAGKNASYDLGLGDATQRNSFTAISGDWLVIKSSGESTAKWALGIKFDGTLWGVGDNSLKQLGGLPNASYTTWMQIGTDTDWINVALGAHHMIGLKSSGVAWAVGKNTLGQCGVGNISTCNTLTLVSGSHLFASVTAISQRSAGIKADGSVRTWGENSIYGYAGVGSTTDYHNTPQAVSLPATVAQLAMSVNTTHARLTDGKLYSWGYGGFGVLGNGSTSNRTSPYQVGSGTDWAFIACGWYAAYGIKSGGTAWATGQGNYYATAQGSTAQLDSFTQIGSATDWAEAAGGFHCLLLRKTSGAIWVVGYNYEGELGAGTGHDEITSLTDIEATYGATFPDGDRTISAFHRTSYVAVTLPPQVLSAPIEIVVEFPHGTLAAPIEVNAHATGTLAAPLRIAVADSLVTTRWSASVMLDGDDVSSRLAGSLTVDAEEGAARIAAFSILPTTGVVDPVSWTGRSVAIDLVRMISGAPAPVRIFTGLVDVATFDPVGKTLAFTCTDDLQNRVAALSVADIDVLTAGRFSEAVHGTIDEHWAYARARMETRTASLDAGAMGQLRVTEWDGLTVWKTFTEADIFDASFAIDMPRRSEIVNRVDIAYEYRYHRCRERRAWIAWSKSVIAAEGPASGYQYPSQGEIAGALAGCGWNRIAEVYGPSPEKAFVGSPSGWWVDTAGGVASLIAHLSQRHAQPVTEEYALSVSAPASIESNGQLAVPLRGALESDWNPDEWENDYSIIVPDASAGAADYAGTRTRAASDEAILTLLDMAKVRILGSHRNTRPRFALPCLPEADLCLAVEIDTAAIAASGKIARVEHSLDIDSGDAETAITLALSGVAAAGIVVPTDLEPPTPPEPDVGSDPWTERIPNLMTHIGAVTDYVYTEATQGYLCAAPETYSITDGTDTAAVTNSYYDPDLEFVQVASGFRIKMPGVLENYRNPVTADHASEYLIEIPADPITITV